MSKNIVHIVGTGTIGEPLIGLLCAHKEDFGIDEVTFHKNSARISDKPKIDSLIRNCDGKCDDQTAIQELRTDIFLSPFSSRFPR